MNLVCSMPQSVSGVLLDKAKNARTVIFGVEVGSVWVFDEKETSCSRTLQHQVRHRLGPYQKE
jgi:hypothetical protein